MKEFWASDPVEIIIAMIRSAVLPFPRFPTAVSLQETFEVDYLDIKE
jgi:hypothetical protein